MIKFFSEILGSEVLIKQERLRGGKITSIIINPDDGTFLGILTDSYPGKKTAIPASEITGFGDGIALVNSIDSLGEPDDIIRIKTALGKKTKIIGQKVFTESGQKLGKCINATLNLRYQKLDKIYVTPKAYISFLATDLIISAKNIIEIKADRIIVSDEFAKVRAAQLAPKVSPVAE